MRRTVAGGNGAVAGIAVGAVEVSGDRSPSARYQPARVGGYPRGSLAVAEGRGHLSGSTYMEEGAGPPAPTMIQRLVRQSEAAASQRSAR